MARPTFQGPQRQAPCRRGMRCRIPTTKKEWLKRPSSSRSPPLGATCAGQCRGFSCGPRSTGRAWAAVALAGGKQVAARPTVRGNGETARALHPPLLFALRPVPCMPLTYLPLDPFPAQRIRQVLRRGCPPRLIRLLRVRRARHVRRGRPDMPRPAARAAAIHVRARDGSVPNGVRGAAGSRRCSCSQRGGAARGLELAAQARDGGGGGGESGWSGHGQEEAIWAHRPSGLRRLEANR